MSEMEQDNEKLKVKQHEQIVAAIKDLGSLGYRVSRIQNHGGYLDIGCHCPQVNEGSNFE